MPTFGDASTISGANALSTGANADLIAAGQSMGVGTPPTFMGQLTRPEAIGAGIGGLAADAMMPLPKFRKEEEEDKEMPRGMPIKNTSIFPEMGYDAGKLGEFDYLSLIHI